MNQRGRTTGIVLDGGESPGVSIVDVQALFLDYLGEE